MDDPTSDDRPADARSEGSDPILARRWRAPTPPPPGGRCSVCDGLLADRFGWCSGCRAAFCFACGRGHFCRPSCVANGCLAGLCVREVRGGVLSEHWGLPPD